MSKRWRSILPEPFWLNLAALLMLSVLTAVPFFVLAALLWPNATGATVTLMFLGCYLIAVPLTWWLFRKRDG